MLKLLLNIEKKETYTQPFILWMAMKKKTHTRVLQLFREHCYITDKFISTTTTKTSSNSDNNNKKAKQTKYSLENIVPLYCLLVLILYTAELCYCSCWIFSLFLSSSFLNVYNMNLSIHHRYFNCVKSKTKENKMFIPFLFSSVLLLKCDGAKIKNTKNELNQTKKNRRMKTLKKNNKVQQPFDSFYFVHSSIFFFGFSYKNICVRLRMYISRRFTTIFVNVQFTW